MQSLIMPIGDWLFGNRPRSDDEATVERIQKIRSVASDCSMVKVWLSRNDLPEKLSGPFDELWADDAFRQVFYQSREWKSLALNWQVLFLLPSLSAAAIIAALYLKFLIEDHWPRRVVWIEPIGADLVTCSDLKQFLGGYATILWETWRRS